jgi:hypothetical protein
VLVHDDLRYQVITESLDTPRLTRSLNNDKLIDGQASGYYHRFDQVDDLGQPPFQLKKITSEIAGIVLRKTEIALI